MILTRKASKNDIPHIAVNMRLEDIYEIRAASGSCPSDALTIGLEASEVCLVAYNKEKPRCPIAMFGVVPIEDNPTIGRVWLLGTDDIKFNSVGFLRKSKEFVDYFHQSYPLLFNNIDARNTVHIRWLEWLGFSFVRELPNYGAEQRLFYEFARLQHV